MYIVCNGQIDVRIGERTIASLTGGASMGELALLDGEPRSASAVAASNDTLLLQLSAERFRGLLYSQPLTVRALLRTLDRRIRETQGGELSGASAPPSGPRRSLLMRAQQLGLAELVSTMSFLRGVELFGGLSSGELANLAGIAQAVVLYEGDRLFEEGDPGESLYLVCSGRVDIAVGERTVAVLERNACLGEMALISGLPRSATATALRESRLLRIGADDFGNLLSAEPSIAFALLRTLSRRLRDALAKQGAR
jgi:CRP-like cAMP-binding protein